MVGSDFLKFIKDLQVVEYIGVEDFADKLSFMYSVLVLMLCTTILTVKQYLSTSIACYLATNPSGTDFDKFMENFCWVHGTIPLKPSERLPQTPDDWYEVDEKHRINYYQWVPFMLGLQTILFYMPRIIWQLICYRQAGTDIEGIISTANKANHSTGADRRKLVEHVAGSLEMMLYQHRDYRHGRVADARRKAHDTVGMCVASKRLGTWLVAAYFFIKILYLANALGQIFLMQHFLGFNSSVTAFGLDLSTKILAGADWSQTRIFPRVSYCYIDTVRHLGSDNRYIAQCVLPINMLNEKLYIFLWFWTLIVATLTAISIPSWLLRMSLLKRRTKFITKFLRLRKQLEAPDADDIDHFIHSFLRHDGVFLIRMISLNAGDVVAADIVKELYDIHNAKYLKMDFNRPDMLDEMAKDIEQMKNFRSTPMKSDGKASAIQPSAPSRV